MLNMRHWFRAGLTSTLLLTGIWLTRAQVCSEPVPVHKSTTETPQNEATVHPEAAITDRVKALRQRLDELAARVSPDSPVYRANVPYVRLKLETAEFVARGGVHNYSVEPNTLAEQDLNLASQALDLLERGTPIYTGVPPGPQERAYISEIDDSPQPYWVYLPEKYTPDRKWPLVVFLHGYDPSINKVVAWPLSDDLRTLASDRGYIFLVPYGRRNTDFVTVGEVDVLRTIAETRRLFSVDENRIFLSGVSMGGYGVYAVGLHHPGLFAALTPMCGRVDHYLWQHLNRKDVPGFKQLLIDTDNPVDLVDNAEPLPIYIQQGSEDSLVSVEHSRRMYALLKRKLFTVKYDELKGENHWIYFNIDTYKRCFDFLDTVHRTWPRRHVQYVTYTPKYTGDDWVRITGLLQWGLPARVEADWGVDNRVTIHTENVARLEIDVPDAPRDGSLPVSLVVNDKEIFHGQFGDKKLVVINLEPEAKDSADTLRKTPTLCGPIKEAFNRAYLIVPGTQGDDAEDALLVQSAQRMATEWQEFADGVPRIKPDTAVTADDISRYDLILFGDPSSNSIIARVKDKLPFDLSKGAVSVAGSSFSLAPDGLGFMMTYPNPLNPSRLLVIESGRYWGEYLPINHKFDLLPDFIVYSGDRDPMDDTNQYRVAGFFDTHWKFDPKLVWRTGS